MKLVQKHIYHSFELMDTEGLIHQIFIPDNLFGAESGGAILVSVWQEDHYKYDSCSFTTFRTKYSEFFTCINRLGYLHES